MSFLAIFSMVFGIVVTWGAPIAVIISIIILFNKVNRLERAALKGEHSLYCEGRC